jgi:nucleotide-binding universal stress UspA family protein
MEPIQTILHPTDFSESAGHAFRLACSLARDHQARLVVLHVVPPPFPIVGEIMVVPPLPAEMEGEPGEWESLRRKLRAMKPDSGVISIEHRLEVGEPVEAILAVAHETGTGLIAMGTHGRTGLSRLLMGSVAEQVVRKAPCSVLTVKTPTVRPEPMPPQVVDSEQLVQASR